MPIEIRLVAVHADSELQRARRSLVGVDWTYSE